MFTVIIPLYNKAHTIIKTLSTVLNQSFDDFEVIIVDDGSTDNGVHLIKTYTNDQRIKIITQENQGVSIARNRGASESSYEFVTFLDGDDEWQPDFLLNAMKTITLFPDLNMLGYAGFYKDAITGKVYPKVIEKYVDQTIEINYYINPDCLSHLGGCVIRKSVFFNVGGFPPNIKVSEDVCLLLKIGLLGKFVYVGKLMHVYVGNVDGQVTITRKNNKNENRIDEAYVYNSIYDMWLDLERSNPLAPFYLRYKIYHFYLCFLKLNDYESVNVMTNYLSKKIKKYLGNVLLRVIKYKPLRMFLILYLLFSKLNWIIKGHPRVGGKLNKKDELSKRYIKPDIHE